MTRILALVLVAAAALPAQTPSKADLLRLTDEAEAAIREGDWAKAAQLTRSLRTAVEDARNKSMAAAGTELVEAVLAWLPPDTETVVVAQQPFSILAVDNTKDVNALDGARTYSVMMLTAAEKQKLYPSLLGRTLRLAMLGARRFGEEPEETRANASKRSELGMIEFQACAVYAFTEPVAESVFGRPPDESVMGYRTWTSRTAWNEKPVVYPVSVSLLKPDLLIACNNREFLEQMLTRMASPAQPRALPADLPEWKLLDRTAPLWGITHYRGGGHAVELMGAGKDIGQIGMTAEFGVASGGARARMLSRSDPWKELVDNSELAGMVRSRKVSEGVWEISIDGNPQAANMAAFGLMAMLGFAVFI